MSPVGEIPHEAAADEPAGAGDNDEFVGIYPNSLLVHVFTFFFRMQSDVDLWFLTAPGQTSGRDAARFARLLFRSLGLRCWPVVVATDRATAGDTEPHREAGRPGLNRGLTAAGRAAGIVCAAFATNVVNTKAAQSSVGLNAASVML